MIKNMAQMPVQYYERFDPAKNYEEHLFIAGRPMQSAEFNEVQKNSAYRLKNIADSLFKDGDIIQDAGVTVDGDTGEVTCESGAIYISGAVRGVPIATLTIPVTGEISIGIRLAESVVTSLEDPDLLDPATGTRAYNERGADRLKIEAVWGWDGDGEEGAFFPVYKVIDGILGVKDAPPNLDAVTQALARYDRDSAGGTYVVAVQNALGLKANMASPVFSGTPSTQNTGSSSEHTLEAANNGDYAGVYRIRAARGSLASKSAVLDGDLLGAVQFEAWNGAAYKVAARIKSFMSGAVGVNDTPGAISIETTPDGSAAPVQRLLITPDGKIQVKGPIDSNIVSIAANTIDCSTGTYFIRMLTTGAFTPVFSNPPTGVAYGFTLKLVYTGGTITWPASVKWANSLAPNFSTGKTHLIMFSTDDGGVTWRGAALMNYTG